MGCHWTGLIFGRIFTDSAEDQALWERLWAFGEIDNGVVGLFNQGGVPDGLTATHDGDVNWTGFPIAITDEAARGKDAAVGFTACSLDQLRKHYAPQIAVVRLKWNNLRRATKTEHNIDIGEGTIIFASDYR